MQNIQNDSTKYTSYAMYRQTKANYKILKNHIKRQNGKKSYRGLMVQAPMGTGKSYYLYNAVPKNQRDSVLDGDALLQKANVKNRNYYWYDQSKHNEREAILKIFNKELENGKIILYSGNPQYIQTDVMVLPDKQIRWDRLQNRDDFKPSKKQFDREQSTYEKYAKTVPVVFNSDIPPYQILESIRTAK